MTRLRVGILLHEARAVWERASERLRPPHPTTQHAGRVYAALARQPRSVRSIAWSLGLGPEHDDDVRRALDRLVRRGFVRRVDGADGAPLYGRPTGREVGRSPR